MVSSPFPPLSCLCLPLDSSPLLLFLLASPPQLLSASLSFLFSLPLCLSGCLCWCLALAACSFPHLGGRPSTPRLESSSPPYPPTHTRERREREISRRRFRPAWKEGKGSRVTPLRILLCALFFFFSTFGCAAPTLNLPFVVLSYPSRALASTAVPHRSCRTSISERARESQELGARRGARG